MERKVFFALCALVALALALVGPIPTSDGMSHVTMAHFMGHAGDPALPMLQRLYEANPHPAPNLAGHWLLMGLMQLLSPLAAENALQILCVVSLPLAARLVLAQVAPAGSWLALCFLPLAFHRLFFYGLYNFCLSITGCLLCLWAYARLRERPGFPHAVLLAGLMLLTLLCHAGGWMQAELSVATLALVEGVPLLMRPADRPRAARLALWVTFACTPSLAVMLLHSWQLGSAGGTDWGFAPMTRLYEIAKGDPFATIGTPSAVVALVMNLLALALVVAGFKTLPTHGAARPAMEAGWRRAWLCLPALFLVWALVIPEKAGGGWTHAWRAAVFPVMGLLLASAVLQIPTRMRQLASALGVAGLAVALGLTLDRQLRHVAPVEAAFAEIDRLVPAHCALAPIFSHFKLDAGNRAQYVSHPLFNMSNRLELRDDRPVLFKYLARLSVYPVRFRENADPHGLLYGWTPLQTAPRVYELHLERYEKSSGIAVSYVLLGDIPPADNPGAYAGIRRELALHFTPLREITVPGTGLHLELHRRKDLPESCGTTH